MEPRSDTPGEAGEPTETVRVEVRRRGGPGARGEGDHWWSTEGPAEVRVGGEGAGGGPKTTRGCSAVLGLLLVCLLVFVPGFFSLPVVDRDEARFAQASRQMFESVALAPALRNPARHGGGVVVPMLQDQERLNKPPLIYWLQATSAATWTMGRPGADAVWMYRVPSLIGAVLAVLLTWRLGLRLFDSRTGSVGAAILALSPLIAWEAHQARADMVLLATVMLAQYALWRVGGEELRGHLGKTTKGDAEGARPRDGGRTWAIVFWIAIAAGILVKGPVTPMVAAFTAVGVSAAMGRWRWLLSMRPLIGLVIVLVLVAPWVWAVGERIGWERYLATIGSETFGRGLSPREGHWGPPGYHLVLLPLLLWPGSLLTAAGVGLAIRAAFGSGGASSASGLRGRWMRAREAEPAYIFLLAWIVPAWIVFELSLTKLPHYTMPLYPALAILSAHAVMAADAGALPNGRGRLGRLGFTLWMMIGGVVVGAVIAALGLAAVEGSGLRRVLLVLVVAAFLPVAMINLKQAARWWVRGRFARAQFAGMVVAVASLILLLGIAAPRVMNLSPKAVRLVERVDPTQSRPLALLGYREDSMIFLTRGRAQRIEDHEVESWFEAHPEGLILARRERIQDQYRVAGDVEGFNYTKGRWERLVLIERGLR
jgi:4-amino-4-deoxy-L-arabinose transferase-like glycosyltransferase